MNKKGIVLFSLLAPFLILSSCGGGKQAAAEKKAQQQLAADDWKMREQGLIQLMALVDSGYRMQEETSQLLLNLVEKEISLQNIQGQEVPAEKNLPPNRKEASSDRDHDWYVKELAHFTATEAKGSFPQIFQLLSRTGYPITTAILAPMGRENLDFLMEKAKTGTQKERIVALGVLSILLDTSIEVDDFDTSSIPPLRGAEREAVKELFIRASTDQDFQIRYRSLSGLKRIGADPDVISVVQKIAEGDEHASVREKAQWILDAMKKK